tara:strand:- start:83 stop:241 length:159 start_codon:yes stop_codon:yes gene_type:complete
LFLNVPRNAHVFGVRKFFKKKESRKEILTAPTPQLDLILKFFKLPSYVVLTP